jgi:hypothetical protein
VALLVKNIGFEWSDFIELYLDNDTTGDKYTSLVQGSPKMKDQSASLILKNLNECLLSGSKIDRIEDMWGSKRDCAMRQSEI